ncbi:MAG: sigma-70 family RNA polymerase sigma factor [Candidatus Limnocylindria bacterium]
MTEQTLDILETDLDLIGRIAEGDASSLGALYDRHNLVAFRVALSIVHDRGRAEDVVQEAFLSVWRKGGSYTPGRGSVRSWLIGIVRNRAIDTLRARRASDVDDEATLLSLRDAGPSVVEQVAAKLEGEAIRTALRRLPLGQRQAIANAFFAGLSHAEIAATTGLPLGTVHGRIRLGLRRLRRHLLAAGVGMPNEGIVGLGAIKAPPSRQQRTV